MAITTPSEYPTLRDQQDIEDLYREWQDVNEVPTNSLDYMRIGAAELLDLLRLTKWKKRKNTDSTHGLISSVDRVPVLSYEANCSMRRFSFWEKRGANVLVDPDLGRCVDLGKCRPIAMVISGKPYLGFEVDADHGVGIEIKPDAWLASCTSTAEEAWAYIESLKLSKVWTEDLTGRQRLMFIVIGIIIGQLAFWILKV